MDELKWKQLFVKMTNREPGGGDRCRPPLLMGLLDVLNGIITYQIFI